MPLMRHAPIRSRRKMAPSKQANGTPNWPINAPLAISRRSARATKISEKCSVLMVESTAICFNCASVGRATNGTSISDTMVKRIAVSKKGGKNATPYFAATKFAPQIMATSDAKAISRGRINGWRMSGGIARDYTPPDFLSSFEIKRFAVYSIFCVTWRVQCRYP
jgi:hypothetical protein